ncbi:nitrogenase component 1 [Spirochaetota bacterium]
MSGKDKDFKMQEIHTPSSFEGALWGSVGIKDAVTIFHAPPGCYINQHVNMLVNDPYLELYSSNLSYANVMQGAEEKLEVVINKLIKKKKPKAVIVVTAPSTEVTQDDVEGVSNKIGFKDTVIIRPPIGGILKDGKEELFLQLLDLMEPAKKKKDKSVNIIGPTYSTYNWEADVEEWRRMLSGIGVTVNTVMCAGTTVKELKDAPQAALNLCMYPFDHGVKTAKEMEKRFGTPYMDDIIPIGFENSALWLQKIADFFKIKNTKFINEEMQKIMNFARSNLFFTVTFELSAALSFDNNNTYAVGIGEFFKNEAGLKVAMCAVSEEKAAKRLEKVCDEVMIHATLDQKRDKFVETSPMTIFGNFYDKKISMDEGFQNFIFADMPSIGFLKSENSPFMGFRGAKYIIETVVNETYVNIFLETKGDFEGSISGGVVPWDLDAEQALLKVSEMIPHFVRATAVKKLHQVSEQIAVDRGTNVTQAILYQVSDQYTPTKFKAKFSEVFDMDKVEQEKAAGGTIDVKNVETEEEEEVEVPVDSLTFTMEWDDEARGRIELVPSPYRQVAVTGTEEWAQEQGFEKITAKIVDDLRKEMGM